MKICIIFLLVMILCSCEKSENGTDKNSIYSNWKNYFDENNYKTHYYISSLAININGIKSLSTYGCIDTCTIMLIENDKLINYDSNQFILMEGSINFITCESEKKIWYNNNIIISYYRNASNCDYWQISNFKNPKQSSKYKFDHLGHLWEASDNGLNKFNGENWESYFKEYDFDEICFDDKQNLYASTLPDFDEPGVILRYNYQTWDTLVICSGIAKWVSCMCFDSEDNLWFGVLSHWTVSPESGDGLYKYDGKEFTNYNIWNSELTSNSIIDIAIDKYDNKWIGMYSGGLVKLSRNNEWKLFNKENTPMPFNSVEHIQVDDDNNIWIAIQFFGLARLKE